MFYYLFPMNSYVARSSTFISIRLHSPETTPSISPASYLGVLLLSYTHWS